MKVFDAHCDVLLALLENPTLSFLQKDERLQASFPELVEGNVQVQVFATYVPERIGTGQRFHTALEMVDIFYEQVVGSHMRPILQQSDLDESVLKDQKGAILFVEGAHPLEGSLTNLRTLYRLGVRGMGLTWNFSNELACGCHEPNPGGLSLFGRKVVQEMNHLGMMIDVSHLSDKGFWDVLELSTAPVIASHSCARTLCEHPRNLSDEQIKALIATDGVMGLTFVNVFTTPENRTVWIDDLLRHLDHVCELGGVGHVAFGSDFDGIPETFGDLTRAGKYPLLVEALEKRYSATDVTKFLSGNWLRVFRSVLK